MKIVQAIHIIDNRQVDLAINISGSVDARLLDSGNPVLLPDFLSLCT